MLFMVGVLLVWCPWVRLQEFGNLGSSGSCHLKMIWLRGSYCGSPLIEIGLIWSTTFLLASPLCVRLCAPFQHVFFIQKDQTCKFPKNGDRKFADSKLKRWYEASGKLSGPLSTSNLVAQTTCLNLRILFRSWKMTVIMAEKCLTSHWITKNSS